VRARLDLVRSVVRFGGAVMLTTGLLVLGDAGLTLAWQEPITSYLAARAQRELDRELPDERRLARLDAQASGNLRDSRLRLVALARRARRRARMGRAIGRIELPTLRRSYAVVEGTDTASLEKGPGHYPTTPFPGEGGTVAIAGHRTTYLAPFRSIDHLRPNDQIVLAMPYGRLTYEVTSTRVVLPTNLSILAPTGSDRLVLTACHPVYSADHRLVAFARLRGFVPVDAGRAWARPSLSATGR
jgi:sortase A